MTCNAGLGKEVSKFVDHICSVERGETPACHVVGKVDIREKWAVGGRWPLI